MSKTTKISSADGCATKALANLEAFAAQFRTAALEHDGVYTVTSVVEDNGNRSLSLELLPKPKAPEVVSPVKK